MHGRSLPLIASLLLALAGCIDESAPSNPLVPAAPPQQNAAFDVVNTGTIVGQVVWDGPIPDVAPFVVFATPDLPAQDGKLLTHEPNPFRPIVDPASKGVADAVVFLRGIDPNKARPWPHAPVRIEQQHRRIQVVQGDATSRVGFVRAGDSIEAVNRDPEYHALRARGAAFFTLPFADRDRPSYKQLKRSGIVELSSAAGYYWMQAHLFVVEHGYYARTDREGRFRLEQVPAGNYEAVCWMPSWIVARKDRDPESSLIARAVFAPSLEQTMPIGVRAGAANRLRFTGSEGKIVGRGSKSDG
jgi:hypothetical protein